MHSWAYLVCAVVALLACITGTTGVVTRPSGTKIIGYWGCYPNGLPSNTTQLRTAINNGYNIIIFAFYLVDANGAITKDPGSTNVPTKSSITQDKSFTYLISLFGGETGVAPTLTMDPNAWAQAMYSNFARLATQYGFDGIDIDLENAWGGTGDKVLCGIRAFFKLMHTNGYVVSMAPQTTAVIPTIQYVTGSWNSYAPLLDTGIIQYVDIVAIQMYNNAIPGNNPATYTDSLTNGFSVTGCPTCDGTVTGLVKVPACKLAHGWPSALGAAPSGCPGLSYPADKCPYGQTLTNLYKGSASLSGTSGMMTWSIEWDERAGWNFVNAAKAVPFTGTACQSTTATTAAAATTTAASATSTTVTRSTTVGSSTTRTPTTTTTTTTTTTARPTATTSTAAQSAGAIGTSSTTAKPSTTATPSTTRAPSTAGTTAIGTTATPSTTSRIPTPATSATGKQSTTSKPVSFTTTADGGDAIKTSAASSISASSQLLAILTAAVFYTLL